MISSLPSRGVYALVLRLPHRTILEIGRLGNREFDAGVYVYIGSALNSLSGRIARHLRKPKKSHWHIDYLTNNPSVRTLGIAWRRTTKRVECSIAQRIGRDALGQQRGFGCGDCSCESHLHYFPRLESVRNSLSRARLRYCDVKDLEPMAQ